MRAFLQHVLAGQNQFASGGLLLMVIGGIMAFLRQLPQRLWSWIEEQITLTITVKDDDVSFRWVKEWFLEQKFLKRVRRLDLDTTLRGAELALVPAPGSHRFFRGWRPYWVWFYRTQETSIGATRRTESLTLRTVGRNPRVVRQLVEEIVACHRRKVRTVSYLYAYNDGWEQVEAYAPRSLESVILWGREKERLLEDIQRFRVSRPRYRRLGVPYHRGYLLYGPPGTGKTSLVSALADRFGMSIYAVNLTEMNDRMLKTAINWVPENSVLLFEDIDCMRAGHRRGGPDFAEMPGASQATVVQQPGAVTLSGLLNVLDGFHAPENVVLVMTTNDVDALDPALLRPGRIDYRLYLGQASESQKAELFRRFFPGASEMEAREFARKHRAETMAEFQGILLALEEGSVFTEPTLVFKD
jgi:mitochondrial chaperone BCS1